MINSVCMYVYVIIQYMKLENIQSIPLCLVIDSSFISKTFIESMTIFKNNKQSDHYRESLIVFSFLQRRCNPLTRCIKKLMTSPVTMYFFIWEGCNTNIKMCLPKTVMVFFFLKIICHPLKRCIKKFLKKIIIKYVNIWSWF